MTIDPRPIRMSLAALFCLATLQMIGSLLGEIFWLNLTDSEPMGLYRLEKFEGSIRRGELIVMSVPTEFHQYVYGRHWLPEGWSLFKHVGAVPGDVYCVTASSLTINGVTIGPVYAADAAGLPLPRLRGCRRVPAGHFLPVAVGTDRSFDGRYMGPVKVSAIKGIARPIVTFR